MDKSYLVRVQWSLFLDLINSLFSTSQKKKKKKWPITNFCLKSNFIIIGSNKWITLAPDLIGLVSLVVAVVNLLRISAKHIMAACYSSCLVWHIKKERFKQLVLRTDLETNKQTITIACKLRLLQLSEKCISQQEYLMKICILYWY